jgi:hypothetical protein
MDFTAIANAATTWIVNFFGAHPIVTAVCGVAIILNNALHTIYKDFATRPPWARWAVAVTDPLAFNFWQLLHWIGGKIGLNIGPKPDDTVPASSVAAATKAP